MGLISGDIDLVTKGRALKSQAPIKAYDSVGGNLIDTIPAGTALGVCTGAVDNTTFWFGNWWLSFPAPATPIGAVSGPFWVIYDTATLVNADNTAIVSDAGAGLPTPVKDAVSQAGNFFAGSLKTIEIIVIVLVAIVLLILLIWGAMKLFKK